MPYRPVVIPFAMLMLCAMASDPARANTFNVTRGDDPAPNGCIAGDCSLREAFDAATTTPAADTIVLGSGLYNVTRGELSVVGDVTLQGVNAASTSVVGAGAFILLHVGTLSTLTADNMTLSSQQEAVLVSGGSAVLRDIAVPLGDVVGDIASGTSSVRVERAQISETFACGGSGSGSAHCEAYDSTLGAAAGIGVNVSLDLARVTINGPADGTGIYFYSNDALTISDSTISGQGTPLTLGSTIQNPEDVHIQRTRFIGNFGPMVANRGGGVYLDDVEFRDNIVDSAHSTQAAVLEAGSGAGWRFNRALFVGNRGGSGEGAVVRIKAGANVVMSNVTFDNNTFKTGINGHGNTIGVDVSTNATTLFWLFHATLRRASIVSQSIGGSVLSVNGASSNVNVRLFNSLVDGTCAFGAAADLFQADGNVESTGNTCGLLGINNNRFNIPAAQLRIGTLGDHGGFTQTYLPASGSVLLDTATSSWCLINPLDQRRYLRPAGGSACDVGAVEAGALSDTIFADGFGG